MRRGRGGLVLKKHARFTKIATSVLCCVVWFGVDAVVRCGLDVVGLFAREQAQTNMDLFLTQT